MHELRSIKKKTNEWAQGTSEFSGASQPVNKNRSNTFHGMFLWCFYFIQTEIFSNFNSKIWGKRLWKYIVRLIRDMNDSTSQCKSQCVGNKKYVDGARVAFYQFISLSRHGGSSSKNKQEYKPDVKLEYYDDNGRPLTPKEVRFIFFYLLYFTAFF